jgi:hypothetical protein
MICAVGDAEDLTHYEFTAERCTVNNEIYVNIIYKNICKYHLRDAVRRHCLEKWGTKFA